MSGQGLGRVITRVVARRPAEFVALNAFFEIVGSGWRQKTPHRGHQRRPWHRDNRSGSAALLPARPQPDASCPCRRTSQAEGGMAAPPAAPHVAVRGAPRSARVLVHNNPCDLLIQGGGSSCHAAGGGCR